MKLSVPAIISKKSHGLLEADGACRTTRLSGFCQMPWRHRYRKYEAENMFIFSLSIFVFIFLLQMIDVLVLV